MKFIISATALVAVVAATPLKRQASALEATITQAGNSAVNVALKNLGNADLNLLVGGSILDDAPVDKVYVTSASKHNIDRS
jgi:deuterolysin